MKKLIIYIIILLTIMFLIPVIFIRKYENKQIISQIENTIQQEQNIKNQYDYKKYTTIKLLHEKTGEVEEIKLDDYIVNVVCAEMPANFELEALKAQAVVARTYTIYKLVGGDRKHENADICDNSACCQAWISKEDRFARWDENERINNWNKIVNAVDSTNGKIITYDGQPINAFFHSNSGGTTEMPINVWGGSGYPYLQVVQTAGEEEYSQYNSEVILTKEEFIKKIKEKHSDAIINFEEDDCIKILETTEANRVKTLKIGNIEIAGVEARSILGLRSTNFTFEISNTDVKFSVIGYGHGVGMSQTGADALAKQGQNFEEIIKHFYVGVEIINM